MREFVLTHFHITNIFHNTATYTFI